MNPISLYIHLPWCVRKCPYCDFNSYAAQNDIPEEAYITALKQELSLYVESLKNRSIQSIFFGGGTPSLFSADSISTLLEYINQHFTCNENIEITLEANPGAVEQSRFRGFLSAGVNRLSIGIQSFSDKQLTQLGRIHSANEALHAIEGARSAGFTNINLDIMFGLPNQSIAEGLKDLQTTIDQQPNHISWYQLTLEPNTYFHKFPPNLPNDDLIADMQTQGQQLLSQHGFIQYEVSAYAQENQQCRHNLNYWQFGDYIGIGAGAHGKLTDENTKKITRYWNYRRPQDYLNTELPFIGNQHIVTDKELPLEFMMNALRLSAPTPLDLYHKQTNLPPETIHTALQTAEQHNLLKITNENITVTTLGKQFLNELLALF